MHVLRLPTGQADKVATFEVPVFAALDNTLLLLRLPATLDRKVLELRRQRSCNPTTIMTPPWSGWSRMQGTTVTTPIL